MKTIKNNTKSFNGNLSILAFALMTVLLASAFSSAALSGKVIASSDGLEVSADIDNVSVAGNVEIDNSNVSTSAGGSGGSSGSVVTPLACIDKDDGINYYVKGSLAGKEANFDVTATDYCKGNVLREYSCGENPVGNRWNYKWDDYACPHGCSDGACIQSDSSNTDQETTTDSAVKISMYPEKQKAHSGESVEYVLAVRDIRMTKEISPRTYYLEFATNNKEVFGSFSESKLTFEKSGDGKKVILTVTSTNAGSNEFKVYVKDSKGNIIEGVKGALLVVKKELPETEPSEYANSTTENTTPGETETVPVNSGAYFIGEGFILGGNESIGYTFKINLLKKYSDLRGNFLVKGTGVDGRIQGTFDDGNVKFTIVSKDGRTMGEFSGKVSKFNDFTLLRGELKMSDGFTYSLTATSHNQNVVRAIKIDKDLEVPVKTTTELDEFVVLEQKNESASSNTTEEQYLQPVKVYTKKILGFIPTGKKVLVIKTFSDGEEAEIKINAYSEKKVGEYIVKVGSLDDENNIKLDIKASSK